MDDAPGYRGFDVRVQKARSKSTSSTPGPDDAIKVVTEQPRFRRDKWIHVMVTYDGSRKAEGVKIYVDGDPAASSRKKRTI